jgi:hypothetical protein
MEPAPIQQGRAAVRAVRDRLLRPSPTVFADCLPDLERVMRCLADVQPAPELADLRLELREAEALMRAAGDHYFGSIPATYDSAGRIVPEA